jgi:Fe2+ or Zn2+ uptake regulation protein
VASPTLKRFRLTRTKRAVLQILADHFVLKSRDLAGILRKRIPTANDLRTVQRSLQLLDKAGYVRRIPYFETASDSIWYACGLTDKGVRECGGKTLDEHSERTLDHELEISYFHVALQELCDRHGFVLRWKQSDLKHGVNPDAYFAISGSKGTNHFFLEVERAKIGNYQNGEPSIIRKFARYYEYYNTHPCERTWGFRTYRVVVVLRNNERRMNLLRAMQANLSHRMFWLSVESDRATAFRTPKGDVFSFADFT